MILRCLLFFAGLERQIDFKVKEKYCLRFLRYCDIALAWKRVSVWIFQICREYPLLPTRLDLDLLKWNYSTMRGLLSWKKETWEIVSWSLDTKVTNIIIQLAWKLAFSFAPCVRPENTRLDFYEIWSVLSKQAIWCHIKTEEETHFHPATQDYHFCSAQGIVIVILRRNLV